MYGTGATRPAPNGRVQKYCSSIRLALTPDRPEILPGRVGYVWDQPWCPRQPRTSCRQRGMLSFRPKDGQPLFDYVPRAYHSSSRQATF